MASHPIRSSRLDHMAMGLSGLCLVHCVATAILLGALASAGSVFGKPIIHEVGLTLAMIIGTVALSRGYLQHRSILPVAVGVLGLSLMAFALSLPEGGHEPLFTVVGVTILAMGHRLNMKAGGHVHSG
jgi:hypothetical protein